MAGFFFDILLVNVNKNYLMPNISERKYASANRPYPYLYYQYSCRLIKRLMIVLIPKQCHHSVQIKGPLKTSCNCYHNVRIGTWIYFVFVGTNLKKIPVGFLEQKEKTIHLLMLLLQLMMVNTYRLIR